MNRPTTHTIEAYDYHEVIKYIEDKYKIRTRSIGRDFWHWLLDSPFDGVTNGSFQYLPIKELMSELDEDDWQYEILEAIYKEFNESVMEFWVYW